MCVVLCEGKEQGLELQNGAITLVGSATSVIQRNNFHNTSLGHILSI